MRLTSMRGWRFCVIEEDAIMNQILELREKRAKAWDAAKAFLDSKRGADGMLSAEDASNAWKT